MERELKGFIFMPKSCRLCILVQAKECTLSVMPTFSCLGETRHLALAQEEFQGNCSCMSAHLLPLKTRHCYCCSNVRKERTISMGSVILLSYDLKQINYGYN